MGGAIRDDVRKMNVDVPQMPSIHRLLREQHYIKGSPQMREFLYGAVDMVPRNMLAYFQYYPSVEGENEQGLHQNLKTLVSGHGAKQDHPRVRKAVYESLKHHPKLAHMYLNA